MMSSMNSAVSGLKNHQVFMDVVGNNIANVSTTGFKASRVTFQDVLSQTVRGATSPSNGRGGMNPEQIGMGVLLGGVDTIQSQGTLQATNKMTDVAIQGDGLFQMSDGKQTFFSRDGSFDIGTDGSIVNPNNGMKVMGWQANAAGVVDVTKPATAIILQVGAGMTGKASTSVAFTGNLDSSSALGVPGAVPLSVTAYDSFGNAHAIGLSFQKGTVSPPAWAWSVTTVDGVAATGVTSAGTALDFTTGGKFDSVATSAANAAVAPSITIPATVLANGSAAVTLSLDLSVLTQSSGTSSLTSTTDGSTAGSLATFSIGQAGEVEGIYSNGFKQTLGQIALASFSNPSGLIKAGGNLFTASANSGAAMVGTPGTNGRGMVSSGFLEGSNVDLAQQFTNMIMAERGFQANSRVITTSDEILQDLVNLKH